MTDIITHRTTKIIYDSEVLVGKKKNVADVDGAIRDGFKNHSDYDIGLSQGMCLVVGEAGIVSNDDDQRHFY